MKKTFIFILFSCCAFANNLCVDDVKSQFQMLSTEGREIPISIEPNVFEGKSYILRPLNKFGIDNHFQGIQKLPGKDNFVITGSDLNNKRADLVFVSDRKITKRIVMDVWPYWHPGGISTSGNLLVVPLEEYKKTRIGKINFYNLSNFTKLNVSINIPTTSAGAVFFYNLPDGSFLIGSWDMNIIHFYFSKTNNLLDGFEEKPRFRIDRKDFKFRDRKPFDFDAQGINLITQCDGKLFLFLFGNRGKAGDNYDRALLFSLVLNEKNAQIELVTTKNFDCGKKCNFAAAAGTYINEQGKLFVFSSPHHRSFDGKKYSIIEFGPGVPPKQKNYKN